jgi:aminoglycoside phosphotransferase (APT) family kinase protein
VVPQWVYDSPESLVYQLDELAAHEQERTGPTCLVHGDAHQGNSFLRDTGDRVWLDWQLARQGSPWRDVSYFVVGALTVEERRAADRDLVELHRELLLATGAEGVPGRDDAWREFVLWPAYGTQAWLGNYNAWGNQSGLEMARRTFAALDDYDTVSVLTAGKPPRRPVRMGEGAYRLTPELQRQLDALEAG